MTNVREESKLSEDRQVYSYTQDWTAEYFETAEFALVVQKQLLPVHKHVLSMSRFFQRELFKTESKKSLLNAALKKKEDTRVSTRLKLSTTAFQDTSVEDMCLLLSHVYATEAQLSAERMQELRKLFKMTEEFEFPSLTKRCVNFVRNTDGVANGVQVDVDANGALAACEWLELAVKWDFPSLKDMVCAYAGDHFFEIYGRNPNADGQRNEEVAQEWADLVFVLESNVDLWKRLARSQATRIESGPSLASLISDEPSTTFIYGLLAGILAGAILPSWMFFLILIGTIWYTYSKMPPALAILIQRTVEGALHGVFQTDGKENEPSAADLAKSSNNKMNKSPNEMRNKGKPPMLRKTATRITA